MSDFYTFVSEIIFNDPEKADRIEKEFREKEDEHFIHIERLETAIGNTYFAGFFKNIGGGPWPEVLHFPDLKIVVLCENGTVYHAAECKTSDLEF